MVSMGTVRERLIAAMDARGCAVAELSRATGITSPAISQWRSGETTPSMKNLLKAAAFLRVRVEWLGTGAGEMDAPRETTERLPQEEADILAAIVDAIASEAAELKFLDGAARQAVLGAYVIDCYRDIRHVNDAPTPEMVDKMARVYLRRIYRESTAA